MTAVEELAPRTEDEVRAHLAAGKLVEGLQHMSPEYLKGIRRILTVSADTELVSAPAYLRAATHAPALNNFGSAVSIIQDELAHAHIGYRLLGDLGVDMPALIYEREALGLQVSRTPSTCRWTPGTSSCWPTRSTTRRASCCSPTCTSTRPSGPWKRALAKVDKEETFHLRHGRTWVKKFAADPDHRAKLQSSLDWMFILTLEWFGLPDARKKHGIQLEYGFKGKSNDELRQDWMGYVVPFMEEVGLDVPAHFDEETQRYVIDCPFPQAFDSEKKQWGGTEISWDEVLDALEGPRADERDLRREAPEGLPRMSVEARLWEALTEVEDPEIPISVVHMGLIVAIEFDDGVVDLKLTFTAMGCPAMEFIQDDIRERLLQEPDVDEVRIEIVWDPVWTRKMIREEARETMRGLGIVA